mgnify:CR=1 FL=1
MTMKETRILDYGKDEVREKLLQAFRRGQKEYAAADLARVTGLPLAQINAEMPALADEYRGRLKVSDKGDLIYSFPEGLRSRYKGFGPALARFAKAFARGAVRAGKALFKIWILVTLVGYFVLFIALALVAFFGSIAIQQGGGRDRDNRRGGGGLGGLWLTTRLFDSLVRLWFYSELFKDPETRYRQQLQRRERKPLHKAVFSHVFGDGDPNADWDSLLKKAFVAYVQTHKGVITMPEFMALSGLRPGDAQDRITRFLVEFEGRPEVTENGALYFFFPSLLAAASQVPSAAASTFPMKKLKSFSSNSRKLDNTFRWVNIVNLLFGSYYGWHALNIGTDVLVRTPDGIGLRGGFAFLYSSTIYLFAQLGVAQPAVVVGWLLGAAPLAFSLLFFSIPLVRSLRLKSENEQLKRENLRRLLYATVLGAPQRLNPAAIQTGMMEATAASPKALEEELDHLAAWASGEPDADGTWSFKDIHFTLEEAERVRAAIDESKFAPGQTVFDTEKPL